MSDQPLADLLGAALDKECIHLLTVRSCTLCKDKLFRRDYAKKYGAKKQDPIPDDKPEDHYCDLCRNRKPSSKNRATIRLPRTQHGIWEHAFGRKVWKPGTSPFPWCDHTSGKCVCDMPPTMLGPTVEAPKLHKATHKLNGKWVCDECCHGHCKRCLTVLPKGKPGTRVARYLDGSKQTVHEMRAVTATELFG